jgi:hypothetical protein
MPSSSAISETLASKRPKIFPFASFSSRHHPSLPFCRLQGNGIGRSVGIFIGKEIMAAKV